jgi:hypothetical protein
VATIFGVIDAMLAWHMFVTPQLTTATFVQTVVGDGNPSSVAMALSGVDHWLGTTTQAGDDATVAMTTAAELVTTTQSITHMDAVATIVAALVHRAWLGTAALNCTLVCAD